MAHRARFAFSGWALNYFAVFDAVCNLTGNMCFVSVHDMRFRVVTVGNDLRPLIQIRCNENFLRVVLDNSALINRQMSVESSCFIVPSRNVSFRLFEASLRFLLLVWCKSLIGRC